MQAWQSYLRSWIKFHKICHNDKSCQFYPPWYVMVMLISCTFHFILSRLLCYLLCWPTIFPCEIIGKKKERKMRQQKSWVKKEKKGAWLVGTLLEGFGATVALMAQNIDPLGWLGGAARFLSAQWPLVAGRDPVGVSFVCNFWYENSAMHLAPVVDRKANHHLLQCYLPVEWTVREAGGNLWPVSASILDVTDDYWYIWWVATGFPAFGLLQGRTAWRSVWFGAH